MMAGYSVEAAMAEALGHLNRIACHQIPINEFADVEQATSCQNTGVNHNMIQQQAVAALMNEVEKGKDSITCQTSTLQNIPSEAQLPTTGSWAQVAGSTSSHPVHPQGVGQFMTPLPLGPASLSKQSSTNDENSNTRVSGISDVALSAPMFPEIPEAKAGVLRVYGKTSKEIIQYLTTRIHEGPLQDIRLETNGRTRVTFQHASQALAFLKSNQEMEQMLGYGRFGCGYRVELAEIIDWNDDHRRMNQPIRERRRLSFARKRLFADNMSPEKWKQDIRTLAGPGNIDFLWVFNSGNVVATAVFTSTTVARKVLEVFNRWKDGRNVYSGVSVTYSSDPCEKELVLVKDTARPNIAKNFVKRPIR
ncbi:hypothetical protein BDV37DRAFT_268720 [Aspergillus pseudonomiae]|uniref:RRM domain-containing protein n=1 Tax=Aspergillus pseudonomiae TaxID=1506151 RepID=A0A5N7DNC0_9EURO|nr:uncharacterized protein BDV37DRAFT_268720 [Aspergillus pseudonomiae]KAE8407950.1 hypothetical protein BDV37DRAFT_268720 [Aspergillus pseudonomiae]